MKNVRLSMPEDYLRWLELAREVEPLFGPMVDDPGFRHGLRQAILAKNTFCAADEGLSALHGGIVISREANEISWLAVAKQFRGQGTGAALLRAALSRLDHARPIIVTTFDPTVAAGAPARKLYQTFGFCDAETAGQNPAGIPTVTMILMERSADLAGQRAAGKIGFLK